MTNRNYAGARWWKFDFHTHTPESDDFEKQKRSSQLPPTDPENWLRQFMKKEIDCVAITDHNSGGWVDKLKEELGKIEQNKPDWYRPLHLFPGVEISANGGVHILAIFDTEKTPSDIEKLLDAVRYRGKRGYSDAETEESITDVINEIAERNGIAIPAHAGNKKGLFVELRRRGASLGQVLENKNVYAVELCNPDFRKPQLYYDKKIQWTEVCGSDFHDPKAYSGRYTWIKMDQPSIEGLRLALIDGSASVKSRNESDPNQHAEYFIESIKVRQAKYIGRAEDFRCAFSPFLNAVIGARGSGKSTLLEFMRLALRRDDEVLKSLKEESEKYFQVDEDGGLLTKNSEISLVYRKNDDHFRLNWSVQADKASLEVKRKGEKEDKWELIPGEIKSLFPVSIYSQKQIFELTRDPHALLRIIDKTPEVNFSDWQRRQENLIAEYKNIIFEKKKISDHLQEENELKGQLNEAERQIRHIEKSGHSGVLGTYRKRQAHLSEINRIEKDWRDMTDKLEETSEYVSPPSIDNEIFNTVPEISDALSGGNQKWLSIKKSLQGLLKNAQKIIEDWEKQKENARWMRALRVDVEKYEQLRAQLEQEHINPDHYPQLLQRKDSLTSKLKNIENLKEKQSELENHRERKHQEIVQHREEIYKKRKNFLNKILKGNSSINIEISLQQENKKRQEDKIRKILHCPGDRFSKDIGDLLDLQSIDEIKKRIKDICREEKESKDVRFAKHLRHLPTESMIDFEVWFPEDGLKITFGEENKPLQSGSIGQKTSALLSFLLSYGHEPLLLDQPEDDLDNSLIYNLIVKQLRKAKSKRQVILVTHNANIVVNGDAEMVLPLKVKQGQTRLDNPGSIQSSTVRKRICDVLEGGEEAFNMRYKRINLSER